MTARLRSWWRQFRHRTEGGSTERLSTPRSTALTHADNARGPTANYSKLPLWGEFSPGCLLPLTQRPRTSGIIELADGVHAEIRRDVRAIAVRDLNATEPNTILALGIDRANEALDHFAGTGVAAVNLGDVEEFHVTWRWEDTSRVIRTVHSYAARLRAMAGGSYTEPDGNLVLTPPYGTWNRALRYFRLSQASDDLFDAFRNSYLALEALLNELAPRQPGEKEGQWLERAIREAYKVVDTFNVLSNPVSAANFYTDLWQSTRNYVFHAKDPQTSFLPLDRSARGAVHANLLRCGELSGALAEHLHEVRFLSSGAALHMLKAMCEAVLTDSGIGLSADSSEFNSGDGVLSPASQPQIVFDAERITEMDTDTSATILGRTSATDVIDAIGSIRRCATVGRNGAVGVVEVLDGPLNIDGADHLEVVWTVSAAGVNLRSTYTT